MSSVAAVLWDVGGVFLPSPFSHIRSLADEVGMTEDKLLDLVFGSYDIDSDHPWHRLERGELSFDDCTRALVDRAAEDGFDVDPIALLMRMGEGGSIVREDVVALAQRIKSSGRRAAIVTNNIREFSGGWRGLFDLDSIADVVVDSCEVGLRKPDPAIFELALDRLGGIAPEEAAFLDDAPGNVAAARALGIHAILVEDHYQPALDELEALLQEA